MQGDQHTKYVPYFHGKNKINYINQLQRDHEKLKFCEINNIELIEIFSKDKLDKIFFKSIGVDV